MIFVKLQLVIFNLFCFRLVINKVKITSKRNKKLACLKNRSKQHRNDSGVDQVPLPLRVTEVVFVLARPYGGGHSCAGGGFAHVPGDAIYRQRSIMVS